MKDETALALAEFDSQIRMPVVSGAPLPSIVLAGSIGDRLHALSMIPSLLPAIDADSSPLVNAIFLKLLQTLTGTYVKEVLMTPYR
jgi:hypothetical protein